ncbi:hypothetical protein D9O36_06340 [Zobellia amurskyensis]|uniref:Uncharacterized protein n=1 Tax=Zobellia amurskyensis TaxID=248905 RepID=A0A7X2ZS84_9FLAO|nr:hypothetical protein [Zobellia amurskyensis]MUH35452.1 hypothetical protein [Zobellia amurskyensis]
MILECPPIALIKEATSIQSFVLDVGPLLLGAVALPSILLFFWYFGVELSDQRIKAKLWLVENIVLVQRYRMLGGHLEGLGQKTSICKNCKNDKMQLWNYQQQKLLVVRCRSCKMNYTLTKEHNEYIRLILSEMDGTVTLVKTLIRFKYHELGKLLGRKLALDPSDMNSQLNPLEVFHFTAKKSDKSEEERIVNVFEGHQRRLQKRNRNIEFG